MFLSLLVNFREQQLFAPNNQKLLFLVTVSQTNNYCAPSNTKIQLFKHPKGMGA